MSTFAGLLHLKGRPLADAELPAALTPSPDAEDDTVAVRADGVRVVAREHAHDGVSIALDGWIDDLDDLARRVGVSDEERRPAHVLAAGWRRWGLGLFDRIDGEFTLAVWDDDARRLVLARDRFGTRPLFWARRGDRFAFSSHLADLLEVDGVQRELDRDQLAEYLSFGLVHAPRTLVRGVHQLEPAHWLRVDADELSTRRWWQPHYAAPGTRVPRPADVVPALQSAVERSVRRRLRPGMRPGLYLSGGLGSTAIAAAARTLHRSLPSFTISLSDDPYPESPFAGRIAKLLQLDHRETVVESRDVAAAFDTAARSMDQPVAAASAVLLQLLAQTASDRADVIFSGDGSEELFGGRMLDGIARSVSAATVHSRLPSPLQAILSPALSRSARGRRMQTEPEQWGLSQGIGGTRLFRIPERHALLQRDELAHDDVRTQVLTPFYEGLNTDPINHILHAWLRSRLMEGALVRTGRTADAAGLDARFPLLDREVTTLATALPGRAKIGRGPASLHTRWPLRSMLTGVLPPPLLNRPKRSLPMLHGWLAGSGRLFMEERLVELIEAPHELFHRRALMDLRRQVAEDAGASQRLWALFFLQRWIDVHRLR